VSLRTAQEKERLGQGRPQAPKTIRKCKTLKRGGHMPFKRKKIGCRGRKDRMCYGRNEAKRVASSWGKSLRGTQKRARNFHQKKSPGGRKGSFAANQTQKREAELHQGKSRCGLPTLTQKGLCLGKSGLKALGGGATLRTRRVYVYTELDSSNWGTIN